jgi:hypothetical protein
MTKPVLVLGSRHDVKLPNLHFKNIYTANGAADLVKTYKKNFSDIYHISTFGVQEFLKNISVREKIIKSKPDRLVIRNGNLNIKNYDFENLKQITKISRFKDMSIQISKLDLSIFGFISSELKYTDNQKIYYFFRCLKKGFFQGFSSGLFAALIAANENPLSEIIISGISLQDGGGHFYTNKDHKGFFSKNDKLNQSNQFRNTNRKKVEAWLFKNLKTDVKSRFLSPNIEFCKSANINHLNCSIID